MASKKKLILVPSDNMTSPEDGERIRMSAKVRKFMDYGDSVKVWTVDTSVFLKVYKAFQSDIDKAKGLVEKGELKTIDLKRVGFVSQAMFDKINGNKNVWISETAGGVVMGADPEFLLIDSSGNVVFAQNVIAKDGKVGSDAAMIEVRPDPARTPAGLVKNIRDILGNNQLMSPVRGYKWVAGCYLKDPNRDYPMGGHIHIGNPIKVAELNMTKRLIFFNAFNKVLDELLSIACIKLDGDEMGSCRRSKCVMSNPGTSGWGFFGEWREHDGRLEHRTLSGMWLMHPVIAECVLGTAKAIIDEVYALWENENFKTSYVMLDNIVQAIESYGPMPTKIAISKIGHIMNWNGFDKWSEIPLCRDMKATMGSSRIRDVLNASQDAYLTSARITRWYNRMKSMSTYKKYSKYIDGMKAIMSLPVEDILNYSRDIKENWLSNKKFLINL
ncbi:MAG: hypothetical protein PVG39_22795 [Desulfobacteraceae bacterium]|jgi:hypothetical protein